MNTYLLLIIIFYVGAYLLQATADVLNLRKLGSAIPPELKEVYDETAYYNSQRYTRENTILKLVETTVITLVFLAFVLAGGFNALDIMVRQFQFPEIVTGILYIGLMGFALFFIELPFSVYHTFVIEEKYGFNKTTPATFIADRIKLLLLSALIGGPVLAAIIWFFMNTGPLAWIWCWLFLAAFQVVMVLVTPTLIMPLFNKFIPITEGELRDAVFTYAGDHGFHLQGIYKMDGSKRSSKSNAFFTGFGKSRRIVLFDTLIERHPVPEIVVVLAHEMGHYRKHHILQMLAFSMISSGVMLFLLSFVIHDPEIFLAFNMTYQSVYTGLVFFSFLYIPVSLALGVAGNILSRKNEYEADAFAAETTKDPAAMVNALKTLSRDNLSNLTPHPVKVFLDYSHPPVVDRIRALRSR